MAAGWFGQMWIDHDELSVGSFEVRISSIRGYERPALFPIYWGPTREVPT